MWQFEDGPQYANICRDNSLYLLSLLSGVPLASKSDGSFYTVIGLILIIFNRNVLHCKKI